jgi:hypothetical protein
MLILDARGPWMNYEMVHSAAESAICITQTNDNKKNSRAERRNLLCIANECWSRVTFARLSCENKIIIRARDVRRD